MSDLIDEIRHYREMGATYGEIAHQMGMTRNAVAGHLHRVRPVSERIVGTPRGSQHGFSKLSDADVLEIRRSISKGAKQADLAAKYKISTANVSRINTGKNWKHLLPTENDDG